MEPINVQGTIHALASDMLKGVMRLSFDIGLNEKTFALREKFATLNVLGDACEITVRTAQMELPGMGAKEITLPEPDLFTPQDLIDAWLLCDVYALNGFDIGREYRINQAIGDSYSHWTTEENLNADTTISLAPKRKKSGATTIMVKAKSERRKLRDAFRDMARAEGVRATKIRVK